MESALFIAGSLAFLGAIFGLNWYLAKKRTETMQAYSESRGYTFEGDAHSIGAQLHDFKLFNQGHSARIRNAMRGVKETGAVHICDYQYSTGSGKNRTTHHQTIALLHTPGRRAPHFFMRRQVRFLDAIGKVFGGQDINFEEDPDFSKTWVLQSNGDEALLRRFLSPALREHLNRLAHRNLVVEVNGDLMVIHQSRRLGKHEDIDALLADAVNIRRHWS